MSQLTEAIKANEHLVNQVIGRLVAADAKRAARVIVKVVRMLYHRERVDTRHPPADNPALPAGPFAVADEHASALLVYVPLSLKSRLIDDATGAYGYSHVAIDCGEIDQPTGKRVMTESTTDDVVHRGFQDRYGTRPYVRIPLASLGVNGAKLRACVNAKLGEAYDDKEALTWGAVDDPAKQVCSDLAADCLPRELRDDIARRRRSGQLSRLAVSVHGGGRRVFVSPNGFCEYFGAPRGEEVRHADQLVVPPHRAHPVARAATIVLAIVAIASSIGIWLAARRRFARRAIAVRPAVAESMR